MTDHRLPTAAKNKVYGLVQARGLPPADFQWSDVTDGGYVFSRIIHRPTKYHFDFAVSDAMGDVYVQARWTPADDDGQNWENVYSRDGQVARCDSWLRVVQAEVAAPDLWASVAVERAIPDAANDVEHNTPFATHEIPQLESALRELQAHIEATYPLDAGNKAQVTGRFRYLIGAARRGLGRVDWLNIFIAQVFAMVVVGVIPSGAYGEVMRFAAGLFQTLFHALKQLTP